MWHQTPKLKGCIWSEGQRHQARDFHVWCEGREVELHVVLAWLSCKETSYKELSSQSWSAERSAMVGIFCVWDGQCGNHQWQVANEHLTWAKRLRNGISHVTTAGGTVGLAAIPTASASPICFAWKGHCATVMPPFPWQMKWVLYDDSQVLWGSCL
jgi:hypothetical protein